MTVASPAKVQSLPWPSLMILEASLLAEFAMTILQQLECHALPSRLAHGGIRDGACIDSTSQRITVASAEWQCPAVPFYARYFLECLQKVKTLFELCPCGCSILITSFGVPLVGTGRAKRRPEVAPNGFRCLRVGRMCVSSAVRVFC